MPLYKFYRGDSSGSQVVYGYGLELYLCCRLVDAQGGEPEPCLSKGGRETAGTRYLAGSSPGQRAFTTAVSSG